MFRVLGVSLAGEHIYRRLVTVESATTAELAADLPARLEDVEREAAALAALGLVTVGRDKPRRFAAAAPDVAVEAMLLRRQAELAEARGELGELVRSFRNTQRSRNSDEVIEIVTGAERLTQRYLQLLGSISTHLYAFVRPPFDAVGFADAEPQTQPGVVHRVIYDRTVFDNPAVLRQVQAGERGADDLARVHPDLPMKMLIVDRAVAMLPLATDSQDGPAAVVVRSGGLSVALTALFEHYWDVSVPLALDDEPSPAGPGVDDRRILALLLAGATDATVARQLDVSVRTVQRRVTEMMGTAGVGTRIQLGWYAARNGWL